MMTTNNQSSPQLNIFERIFIWLSGADAHLLSKDCPKWEKIKYEAFGASVLVPVSFGMIASSYAVSTVTSSLPIIIGFTLVWGFIILAIDRLLLSTYRAFATKSKKYTQFILRITIALLMGFTVSHPLTLLLFKDTINSEIEKKRGEEVFELREKIAQEKLKIDDRIRTATENLSRQQQKYEDTVSGKNIVFASAEVTPDPRPSFAAKSQDFSDLDSQIEERKTERDRLRHELEKWQETYDAEIRGIRSGTAGIGPNARAIERDHLKWRAEEIADLTSAINSLVSERNQLSSRIAEQTIQAKAEIAATRKELEKQSINVFAAQQENLLAVIKSQIDAANGEIAQLREEATALAASEAARIKEIETESRSDLMSRTMALHDLFTKPESGGGFALTVYIILSGLFVAIDTLPLVTKFFTTAGPYDMLLHYREQCLSPLSSGADEKFDRDMQYRADVSDRLIHYIPNQPIAEPEAPVPALQPQVASVPVSPTIIPIQPIEKPIVQTTREVENEIYVIDPPAEEQLAEEFRKSIAVDYPQTARFEDVQGKTIAAEIETKSRPKLDVALTNASV